MRGVPLGKPRDPDAEPPRVGNRLVRPDEADELLGELESVAGTVVVGQRSRGVSTQGQDVLDGRCGVPIEDGRNVVLGMAHAGQVRHGRQLGFALDSHDQVVGAFPCRAPRAIGHRDKRRLERLQVRDRLEKLVRSLVRLGRKKLEAERRRTRLENSWMCIVVIDLVVVRKSSSSTLAL